MTGKGGVEWRQNAPGAVFFVRPESFWSSFAWELYLTQSMYVYNFLMLGTDPLAVAHCLRDVVLTKEFWRKHLSNSGAFIPPELAHWDGKDNIKYGNDTQQKSKAIIKVNDSFLGLGDKIVKDFELGSKEGKQWLENIFKTEYMGQRSLLLDFVKPKKEMGVHSVDIVTIRLPDGSYQVLSCLLWAECEGLTSHGTTAGFTIDVKTEQIASKLYQYGVHFNRPGNEKYVGKRIEGVQRACQQAIAAHKSANQEYKWATAVGWDCMFTEKDG